MPTPSEIQRQLDAMTTVRSGLSAVGDAPATTAAAPPAGGAGAAAGAYDTAANRDAMISSLNNLRIDHDELYARFNNLLRDLRNNNLIPE